MRRRSIIVGIGVLVFAAIAAAVFWPRGPHPCRATFEQVRVGMTYDEVCATVGGPPGEHADNFYVISTITDSEEPPTMWYADDVVLAVDFAANVRAIQVEVIEPVIAYHPSVLERLRKRLGL